VVSDRAHCFVEDFGLCYRMPSAVVR
jgi:hypothetical protein